MNIIPARSRCDRICASWPAPLGMRRCSRRAHGARPPPRSRPESRRPSAAARSATSASIAAAAGAGAVGFGDQLVAAPPRSAARMAGVDVAELHLHLGAAGHDARRVGVEQHAADRPHRARAGDLGKAVVDARRQPHHRDPGILAPRHLGRAGMVLLAGQRDPVIPDADDRLDDADPQAARCRACRPARYALRDSRHSAPDRPARAAARQSPAVFERVAQRARRRGSCRRSISVLVERAGERAAAEHVAVMPFLVGPGDRSMPSPAQLRVGGEGARQLERVDHAERAVEPAAIGLGLAVRADQQPPRSRIGCGRRHCRCRRSPARARPRRTCSASQWREATSTARIGRAVDAGLVAAELGQPLQIGDDPLAIDLRHVLTPSRQTCQRINPARRGSPAPRCCVS